MADTKISALTSGNPAQSADIIPIDRAGANFGITAGSVAALGGGANLPWTSLAPTTVVQPVLSQFTATSTPAGSSATQLGSSNVQVSLRTAYTGGTFATWLKTAPATPYTATIGFVFIGQFGSFPVFAVALEESATGKYVFAEFSGGTSNYPPALTIGHWTSASVVSANAFSANFLANLPIIWMAVKDDGTNLTFYYLPDGQTQVQFFQESRTVFLAGGPNKVGFAIFNSNGSIISDAVIVHWSGA